MSANSGIEWMEATWNPLAGCKRISPGCVHCYAEKMAKRLAAMGQKKYQGVLDKNGRWNGVINTDDVALTIPKRVQKPTVWFVNSMSDLFHENVSTDFIGCVFAQMASTRRHRFIVLTKRAERMRDYMCEFWHNAAQSLPNVILGVSAENQKYAEERIPLLLQTPAACHMVSAEPLLGPIYFHVDWRIKLGWIVTGGESGPGARPCESQWIREIVCDCAETATPCFVKQLGASSDLELRSAKGGDMAEWPEDLRVRQFPKVLTTEITGERSESALIDLLCVAQH